MLSVILLMQRKRGCCESVYFNGSGNFFLKYFDNVVIVDKIKL